MLYIGLYREKHEKIFLSETTKPRAMIFGIKHYLVVFYQPRAMIFGIKHYLVVFYQVCPNYTPWAKNGPTLGVTCFT